MAHRNEQSRLRFKRAAFFPEAPQAAATERTASPTKPEPRRCIRFIGPRANRGLTLVEIAIVLLVMGVLIGAMSSMISSIPVFRSNEDEAEVLRSSLNQARNTALLTNQTFYLEFNLDENSYRGYLTTRIDGELKQEDKLKRSLSDSNGLAGISVGLSGTVETGKVIIAFQPDGSAEQLAIYLGQPGDVSRTIIMNRYGGGTKIVDGEEPLNLEKPNWSVTPESF
ncbi:MAG: GspH/FimT family pseudopilin [Leptospiraceae bacterium]|nr:GspH/FimT family pseudopilin [Leptospiraceae bacterium]